MPQPDPLLHVPSVALAPPTRCYQRAGNLSGAICGDTAHWLRPGNHWFTAEYFCGRHHGPADVALPAVHVFRRVRFSLDVLFAGAHINAPQAHLEALARLELAVQSAGGLLDVHSVHSSVVKSSPQRGAELAIGAAGDTE